MTTKTPELLPCPFCGKAPQLVKKDVEPQGDPWYGMKVEEFILCECGCSLFDGGFHDGFYDAEERAPKAWNTRADRDQLRARVSELEAENARLRLAAIEDAKDHDRRVSECERWADRLKEVERERDHWKANAKNQAEIRRVTLTRPDLKERSEYVQRIISERDEAKHQHDAATEALTRARVALQAVINSAVEPEKAKFACMVPLAPIRAALAAAETEKPSAEGKSEA